MAPSVWDHDLWQEIYGVPDPLTRNVLVNMYRLILDMRESDILAEKVADRVNARRRMEFTLFQKVGAGVFAVVVAFGPAILVKYA